MNLLMVEQYFCIKFHFTLRTLHQKFMKCLKQLLVTKLQFRHGKALV